MCGPPGGGGAVIGLFLPSALILSLLCLSTCLSLSLAGVPILLCSLLLSLSLSSPPSDTAGVDPLGGAGSLNLTFLPPPPPNADKGGSRTPGSSSLGKVNSTKLKKYSRTSG